MSVLNVKVYRCIARDAVGMIVYRVNVVADGPKHASRTVNAWLKQHNKGFASCDPTDCIRTEAVKRNVPLLLDWKE